MYVWVLNNEIDVSSHTVVLAEKYGDCLITHFYSEVHEHQNDIDMALCGMALNIPASTSVVWVVCLEQS